MNIKDTWLLIRSDKNILVNLYWFIKCRSCGLCIEHTLIEHEIALSGGNIKLINDIAGIERLIDITERNATYRLNFTGGNVLLISHDKKDINANSTVVSRFIPCIDYSIETFFYNAHRSGQSIRLASSFRSLYIFDYSVKPIRHHHPHHILLSFHHQKLF